MVTAPSCGTRSPEAQGGSVVVPPPPPPPGGAPNVGAEPAIASTASTAAASNPNLFRIVPSLPKPQAAAVLLITFETPNQERTDPFPPNAFASLARQSAPAQARARRLCES